MKRLLKNCRLFDGIKMHAELMSLLIEDGKVMKIAPEGAFASADADVCDLGGKILSPGFIDLHSHMRDPGQEWREDIASGSMAGAAGGFSLLVAMPNTAPAADSPAIVKYVLEKGGAQRGARILPTGTVSRGRKGEELAELLLMTEAGAVLFTDDGAPVSNARLLRQALESTKEGLPLLMEHPEEPQLFHGGQVHEGFISARSGLEPIPSSCEEIGVARGIALARETGGRMHFTHLSSAVALEQVRRAKGDGINVTCDVTAHHLTLCEMDVWESGCDSRFKVNPPLRSSVDREALWQGIIDGTVDAIVTDHAPWHMDEKDLPFQEAPFGIASLECAFAAVWDYKERYYPQISTETLLQKLTSSPAALLPEAWRAHGVICEGNPAHLVVIDPEKIQEVDCSKWHSKARLTAWEGTLLKGWPVETLYSGQTIWKESV